MLMCIKARHPLKLRENGLEALWIETKLVQSMFPFKDFIYERESLEGKKMVILEN